MRTILQIAADGLLPGWETLESDVDTFSKRYQAASNLLQRLPDDPYRQFLAKIGTFRWFIPAQALWGMVLPLESVKVIYLNPLLEFCPDAAVLGLVGHEVAHVVLDHLESAKSKDEQEEEADTVVRSWGFIDELNARNYLWELSSMLRNPQYSIRIEPIAECNNHGDGASALTDGKENRK